jgi:2-polyprenyl-3-methyl-5-hydroxy-6-metoxy-1,4-benzoquinol methylase
MNAAKIRSDFDEIARLAETGASGTDQYDPFLVSLVPADAIDVLDVGCGLGRLTSALARGNREVLGIDLSPAMIERARMAAATQRVSFVCGDFLYLEFGARVFDCVISAATLHHMPEDVALARMVGLLRPGGRLIIQDLRRDACLADMVRSHVALAQVALGRLVRTGRLRSPRKVRQEWERHGAGETYLSLREAQALANRLLLGARVYDHWLWRYTIVWDKLTAA